MKKLMQLSLAVLCTAFVFASCGDSVSSDVKKFKGYMCKGTELNDKAQAGDEEAKAELEKMRVEMDAFVADLQLRYPEGSDDAKKFEEEVKKVMENPEEACK